MSAEYEDLVTIKFVTDQDCGMYTMGEVDGSFQKHQLVEFMRTNKNGKTQLLEHLAYLQFQVIEAYLELNAHEQEGCCEKTDNAS